MIPRRSGNAYFVRHSAHSVSAGWPINLPAHPPETHPGHVFGGGAHTTFMSRRDELQEEGEPTLEPASEQQNQQNQNNYSTNPIR
jgi:hypothetical protein